ncbi:MAG: UPF0149 family protein [Pseudomonadota bacterium]|nr:UPF0149 family protein [Pseudomonadota bacterium]
MTTAPDHPALSQALNAARAPVSASELHGSITALASALAPEQAMRELDAQLEDVAGSAADALCDLARACMRDTQRALGDPDLSYVPLLPEGGAPLPDQAVALVDFCRGFLEGLGLAGVGAGQRLPAEVDEVLRAFAELGSGPVMLDDDAGDLEALTELIEFVRVGVMLVHAELGVDVDRAAT